MKNFLNQYLIRIVLRSSFDFENSCVLKSEDVEIFNKAFFFGLLIERAELGALSIWLLSAKKYCSGSRSRTDPLHFLGYSA